VSSAREKIEHLEVTAAQRIRTQHLKGCVVEERKLGYLKASTSTRYTNMTFKIQRAPCSKHSEHEVRRDQQAKQDT
jgi:hypothetical protein